MGDNRKIDGTVTISVEDYERLCKTYKEYYEVNIDTVRKMLVDKSLSIDVKLSSGPLDGLSGDKVFILLRDFSIFLNTILRELG
jgi:hypothetical protein